MRRSIRVRIAVTFILLTAFALLLIGLINILFLGDVYLRQKERALTKSWRMVNETDGELTEETINFCSVNALTYAVADPNLNFIDTNASDSESMASRLFGNLAGFEDENTTVIKTYDLYQMIRIHDSRNNMDYLELWGTLENADYYIALTPLESIDEAARLSTRFYVNVGLLVIGASALLIWLITRRLVKPIRELTGLSRRMAELDFDARYQSGGEDEIGTLGRNFNTMSEHLEKAVTQLKEANAQLQRDIEEKTKIDERRREFIANVSHELKTPIALIQGYAEGLRDIADDEESRSFYTDVIIDEADKMNKQVRQLITLIQIESGEDQITVQTFDLAEVIRGVVQNSAIMIREKNADVHFEQNTPVYVRGDAFRIEEVVTNYLTNALNHMSGENRIEISCRRRGKRVETAVFNTGKQIPQDSIERIWDKFYKVDKARTRAYGGSGIGLSIVKAIMDQHGQTCRAENRKDGVVFYFTLDAADR